MPFISHFSGSEPAFMMACRLFIKSGWWALLKGTSPYWQPRAQCPFKQSSSLICLLAAWVINFSKTNRCIVRPLLFVYAFCKRFSVGHAVSVRLSNVYHHVGGCGTREKKPAPSRDSFSQLQLRMSRCRSHVDDRLCSTEHTHYDPLRISYENDKK